MAPPPLPQPAQADRRDGQECQYTRNLDLETLVWTRGPNFPLSGWIAACVPEGPVPAEW
jgi:hypothetical protein